jgi:hypothetical protein
MMEKFAQTGEGAGVRCVLREYYTPRILNITVQMTSEFSSFNQLKWDTIQYSMFHHLSLIIVMIPLKGPKLEIQYLASGFFTNQTCMGW